MKAEIQGHTFEIEEQKAVRVETLRVGDRVNVLHKPSYGSKQVYAGVIIGFEPFPSLPTVLVAYIEQEWSQAKIKTVAFNEETKDFEMVKALEAPARGDLDKENVIALFDREIEKAVQALRDAQDKKAYFVRNFAAYWTPVQQEDSTV